MDRPAASASRGRTELGYVATPDELARWEAAWAGGGDVTGLFQSALLADPDCNVLTCRQDGTLVGGATAYTADGVTGISNVFKSGSPLVSY